MSTLFRTCALAICTIAVSPLQAQWAVATWFDQVGVSWRGSVKTQVEVIPAQVERIYPWGELSLNRAWYTTFNFQTEQPSDTFQVNVFNKDEIPFKLVHWKFGPTSSKRLPNTTLLDWEGHDTLTRATLTIKTSFSRHQQVALVHVGRIPVPRFFTIDSIADTLRVVGRNTILSIENRRYEYAAGSKKLLTAWKYQYFPVLRSKRTQLITGRLDIQTHAGKIKKIQPSLPQRVTRRGKTRLMTYTDFQLGDTLVFVVTPKKPPVKSVSLTAADGRIINRMLKTDEFKDTIVVKDIEPSFTLHITEKASWKKRHIDVVVWRIRPVVSDSVYFITDTLYETQTPVKSDTLLLTICDDSLMLSPIWNIESTPFGQVEVQIPKEAGEGFKLMYAAYWIGIGRNSLNDYSHLEASIPPDWVKPGAPPALGAFGLGRPLLLPSSGSSDVLYAFTPGRTKELAKPGQNVLLPSLAQWPGKRFSGILNLDMLRSKARSGVSLATNQPSYNFFACFQNTGTVNTWPIAVKVVGFYRRTTAAPSNTVLLHASSNKKPLAK